MAGASDFFSVLRRLAVARVAKGKTQSDIAFALKVTRQAVAAWEAGIAWPTADKLFAWSSYLGFELVLVVNPVAPSVEDRRLEPVSAAA